MAGKWYYESLLGRAQVRAAMAYGNMRYWQKESLRYRELKEHAPHADLFGIYGTKEYSAFGHYAAFHWDMVAAVQEMDFLAMRVASMPDPIPEPIELDDLFEF